MKSQFQLPRFRERPSKLKWVKTNRRARENIIYVNTSVRSRARFHKFVHTLGRVVAKPIHQHICAVATRRNTQI